MPTGKVKWFNAVRGYGAITPDDDASEVYVHVADVNRSRMCDLKPGQRLSFEVEDRVGGRRTAVRLRELWT